MSFLTKRCSSAVWLGLSLAASGVSDLQAATGVELVPYKGQVSGELTCLPDLLVVSRQSLLVFKPVPGSMAAARSSHLGSGVQRYEPEQVIVIPTEAGLLAQGTTQTVAANGDVLNVWFSLDATYTGHEVTEGGTHAELVYDGEYRILPGGTGRFAYSEDCDQLGAGLITGAATLTVEFVPTRYRPVPVATLTFSHTFEGTLAMVKSDKRERERKEPAKKAKKGE